MSCFKGDKRGEKQNKTKDGSKRAEWGRIPGSRAGPMRNALYQVTQHAPFCTIPLMHLLENDVYQAENFIEIKKAFGLSVRTCLCLLNKPLRFFHQILF